MGKITATFFMTLDGVVESPQAWHFPYQDEAMTDAIREGMHGADAMLFGRRTYEEWAAYWPHQPAGAPMAEYFNGVQKYVVSTTLAGTEWQNSTLISDDPLAAVRELKAQSSGGILMSGSGTLVTSLLEAGLVDELRVMVHPILVGRGERLFDGGEQSRKLRLVDSTTLGKGVLNLRFEPEERS